MSTSDSDNDAYGPILPPSMSCTSDRKDEAKTKSLSNSSEVEDEDAFLPALPPHLLKTSGKREDSHESQSVTSKAKASSNKLEVEKEMSPHSRSSNPYNIDVSQKSQKETLKRINEVVSGPSQRKAVQKDFKQKQDFLRDDEDSVDDMYGPALPPNMLNKKQEKSPILDKRNIPELAHPVGFSPFVALSKKDSEQKQDSESDDDDNMYGPALPPHLLNQKQEKNQDSDKRRILGPTLPKGYIPLAESFHANSDKEESSESEDMDGPMIGPTPSTQEFNEKEYRMQQLELRAMRMKEKIEGKHNHDNKSLVRESWMIELPEDKPNFCGLGPRQFLRKTPQQKGDRSMWTDTPADKERKAKMGVEEKQELNPVQTASKRRDEELSEEVNEYNKAKRAKPLIDIHRKNIKEKDDKSGPKERRPFSREEDLNVNKFDEAQKSSILKKARQLNDRFSTGDKKFL